MTTPNFNTRKAATDILYNILKNNVSFADEITSIQKSHHEMTTLDMKFISEIVNGVLRNLNNIDYRISMASKIRLNKISPYVLSILRVGVYQILFMTKVPVSAAVNECVKITKKSSNYKLSGFVNAVLRQVDIHKNDEWTFNDKLTEMSVRYSFPQWLVEKLTSVIGDETEEFLNASNAKPSTVLRVNTLKTTSADLIENLNAQGWLCKPYHSEVFSDIDYLVEAQKIDNIEASPEYQKGHFYIQDPAASFVAEVLNPESGSLTIDMCASPGGKTTHLAEKTKDTGRIIAFDVSEKKIKRIQENYNRLGLNCIEAIVGDSTILRPELVNKADYILVDAPCSGIGIIRKKPDIKHARKEEDFAALAKISLNILNTAANYLKVGGKMVFSTCTIMKEENEDVLFEFLKSNPNFKLSKISCDMNNEGYITLYPHKNNCDGFFISSLIREK